MKMTSKIAKIGKRWPKLFAGSCEPHEVESPPHSSSSILTTHTTPCMVPFYPHRGPVSPLDVEVPSLGGVGHVTRVEEQREDTSLVQAVGSVSSSWGGAQSVTSLLLPKPMFSWGYYLAFSTLDAMRLFIVFSCEKCRVMSGSNSM